MPDVTQILLQVEAGDPVAAEQLLPLIYKELRKLAGSQMMLERCDHTLQPTALVHEAYLRLVNTNRRERWNSRGHFFAAAAEAMRRILIESARTRRRLKRSGARNRVSLEAAITDDTQDPEFLLMINEALEKLAIEDQRLATLVKLRYFVGLSLTDAAEALQISRSTAIEDWAYARARLRIMLQSSNDS